MNAVRRSILALCLIGAHATRGETAANNYFAIQVVDEQTGRGVPLAELKTVNNIVFWTDSAGLVAFHEPGLMGQEVFFHVSSPGYEYPKDFFNNRGLKLRPVAGQRAKVKLKRLQIAERLYRVTGQGIYRDSVLVSAPVPLKFPVLDAQVLGQDTVIATPYRGKIYWFWGDTDRASYPLGNFGAAGATSELPDRGGLNPSVGLDLTYFTNADGFSKPMCPDSSFGEGLKWIEGVTTLRDETGAEHLLARVAAGTGMQESRDWHLALFNDRNQTFESLVRWDIHDTHDSAHPFQAREDGIAYLYLYPNLRVRAELNALRDLKNYQAFTCLSGDGKFHGKETQVDRDFSGRVRYSWKAEADRLHPGVLRELTANDTLKRSESWLQLVDLESGAPVEAGRGSVFWNEFLHRWIMIVSGAPGDVWFSQADTPTGPWVYARRIATHGRYNFYNPTQHPFFDQEGGRLIYFEGTYTDSFSSASAKTPRYNYNQIMYRLALDDERLAVPVPVYRVKGPGPVTRPLLREGVEADGAWGQIDSVAFFAIPPTLPRAGLVSLYASATGPGWQTRAPTPTSRPLFFALPVNEKAGSDPSTAPALHEVLRSESGEPIGRVWKNPATVIPVGLQVRPGP
ncbi:MAG TPA: hypothetical protein PLX89_21925 [Verrucomicrobiota bacterium]|nr:hypothetical protein [Verrucomicrobiales bacterium]HRI15664.1 hypothetical protein [Verrucomicrobiota bacterium]